jgi:BirA family biotin operon repressor/biotin-[acetyl-CoA-carboxylase] ligase
MIPEKSSTGSKAAVMSAKKEVLVKLKDAAPGAVSGQVIADALALSRTSVWKAVNALKKEGYLIASSTRSGYKLVGSPDLLLPAEIESDLQTGNFGKRGIHYYGQIGSTNDRARELALEGCPEGTLVVAESQYAGRGRLSRTWESPGSGGLYFSLILRPTFAPSEAPRITLLAGVGVCSAINKSAPIKAAIKWPNDILCRGRKLGGILTEMEAEIDLIRHIVVGIGINVNTERSSFAEKLRERVTSLREETGRSFSRQTLLGSILLEIEKLWTDLPRTGFAPIRDAWKDLNITIGNRVRVERMGQTLLGEALDLDHEGSLLLKAEDGSYHRISSGELTMLRMED